MRIETLKEDIQKNIEFLKELEKDLIPLMKELAIDCLSFPKQEEVDAINNITNTVVAHDELGLSSVRLTTGCFPYEDFSIELNRSYFTVNRQKGHSNFEEVHSIPITVLRKVYNLK